MNGLTLSQIKQMGGVPTPAPTASPITGGPPNTTPPAPSTTGGLTLSQVKQMGGTPSPFVAPPAPPTTNPTVTGMLDNIQQKQTAQQNIVSSSLQSVLNTWKNDWGDIVNRTQQAANPQSPLNTTGSPTSGAMNAAHAAGDVGEMVSAPFGALINVLTSGKVGELINAAGGAIGSTPQAQQAAAFADQHPDATRFLLQDIPNMLNAFGTGVGVGGGIEGTPKTGPEYVGPTTQIPEEAPPGGGGGTPPANGTPPVSPETQSVIANRVQGLQSVVNRYASVSNAVDAATAKGFDPLTDIASDDRFTPTVDKNGTIDTSQAVQNLNNYIKPAAVAERTAIEASGVRISFDSFQNEVMSELKDSNLVARGASYKTILSRIQSDLEVYKEQYADDNGTISAENIDDIKNAKYSISNWNNEDAQISDKLVARAARQEIIDNVKNADVQGLNKVMSQYYSARDVLDAMDGKKVQGGRLGTYFARTIGSVVGSHFGPIGSVLGSTIADHIQGAMMQNTFGSGSVGNLDTPDVVTQAQTSASTPPLQLKSPNPASPNP